MIAEALDENFNFLGLAQIESFLEIEPRFLLENDLPLDTKRVIMKAPCGTVFLKIGETIYSIQAISVGLDAFTCQGTYLLIPQT